MWKRWKEMIAYIKWLWTPTPTVDEMLEKRRLEIKKRSIDFNDSIIRRYWRSDDHDH